MSISFSVDPNTIPKGKPVNSLAQSADIVEAKSLGLNLNKIEIEVES